MGKWKYINLSILAVAIVYMYLHIHNHYNDNLIAYVIASLGIVLSYAAGYYIFDYKIRKSRQVLQKPGRVAVGPRPGKTGKARPKVVLKQKSMKDG